MFASILILLKRGNMRRSAQVRLRMRAAAGALQTREIDNRRHLADLKAELEVLSKMLTALIKGTDKREQ